MLCFIKINPIYYLNTLLYNIMLVRLINFCFVKHIGDTILFWSNFWASLIFFKNRVFEVGLYLSTPSLYEVSDSELDRVYFTV